MQSAPPTIVSVTREKPASPRDVYNFEVEGFHTYFVASAGVWVHNACAAKVERHHTILREILRKLRAAGKSGDGWGPVYGTRGNRNLLALPKEAHRSLHKHWHIKGYVTWPYVTAAKWEYASRVYRGTFEIRRRLYVRVGYNQYVNVLGGYYLTPLAGVALGVAEVYVTSASSWVNDGKWGWLGSCPKSSVNSVTA